MFASIFSLLSIMVSVFEYISVSSLLKMENILVIRFDIESREFSSMKISKFSIYENSRKKLCIEMGKLLDLDYRLIELLKPKQTQSGIYLIFHIRSDTDELAKIIGNHVDSGKMATCFYKQWQERGLQLKPKITGYETKQIKSEKNRFGKMNSLGAVIAMGNTDSSSRAASNIPTMNMVGSGSTGYESSANSSVRAIGRTTGNNGSVASASGLGSPAAQDFDAAVGLAMSGNEKIPEIDEEGTNVIIQEGGHNVDINNGMPEAGLAMGTSGQGEKSSDIDYTLAVQLVAPKSIEVTASTPE